VEHDHPHAFEFLRKDLSNVTDYFKRKGVEVLSLKQLFDFVTSFEFGNTEEAADRVLEQVSFRSLPLYTILDNILRCHDF
jgi:RIO kinase 1